MPYAFAVALLLSFAATGSARAQGAPFGDDAGDDEDVRAVPVLTDLSPRDTAVLRGADLLREGYRTLGEALAYEVGFSRERTSRGFRYALRGIPAGVLLVVDDVPQVVDGERDVLDVDDIVSLVDVDKVEIVRGPVTALHGAGALTGVVRITTAKPGLTGAGVRAAGSWLAGDTAAPGEEQLSTLGTLRAGDIGARVSARLWGGPAQMWRLRAVPTRYQTVNTVTLPVTKQDVDVAPSDDGMTLRLVGQWSDFVVDASAARTSERSPVSAFSHGLADPTLTGVDAQTTSRGVLRGRLLWQRWLGAVHVEAAAFAARQSRIDDGPLFPSVGVFADGGELTVSTDATTAGGLARIDLPVTRDHRLVAAAFGDGTALHARSSSRDPRTGLARNDAVALDDATGTGAAALEWQGDFGFGVHATAGVAAELRTAFPIAIAPRAAVAWTPQLSGGGDALTLRAAYAEGTRTPDRYDVVALAQTVVDGRVVGAAGNDELRPEHVRILELSASVTPSPRLALDVRGFALRHEDALTHVVQSGLLSPTNLPPRVVVGGEATGVVSPFRSGAGEAVQLEGGLAAARTVAGPSVGADLLQATSGVRVRPVDGFTFGGRARAVARDAGLSALVDVWAAYAPGGAGLAITAAVTNLLDGDERSIDAAAPPQTDPLLLPSPGRIFTLGVEGRL